MRQAQVRSQLSDHGSVRRRWGLGLLLLGCVIAGPAPAADQQATTGAPTEVSRVERAVMTKNGLRFSVPEDWPIEQHGGGVGPIAVEDYVVRKFTTVEARLAAMEQRLAVLERQDQDDRHANPDTRPSVRNAGASGGSKWLRDVKGAPAATGSATAAIAAPARAAPSVPAAASSLPTKTSAPAATSTAPASPTSPAPREH